LLALKNITKDYSAGGQTVHALNGISLEFRKSEFVSILGQSGCGKTTLLNIVGGLDKYTSGDLIICGKSTKNYTDEDWDTYRNHTIGFVFQSYNLIPHQTVLSNVELALTLSGVSKAERRQRSIEALSKVGLSDQLHKKPNQLSGGQMQRVAIARALVNDPEILLADEPTGALDSENSVQLMELLKEISKDKLIIMVTHNPELAEKYSTRIIKLLDGRITDDSNPYTSGEIIPQKGAILRHTSMSLMTALSLSFKNLLTKKGRTFMVSLAGSIGIIGIALILAISTGVQNYIDRVQEDTLSGYPLTIEAESADMSSLVTTLMKQNSPEGEANHELDAVYSSTIMHELVNSFNTMETKKNNLEKFKKYIDGSEGFNKYASSVQYSYDLNFNMYTKDVDGNIIKSDVSELMSKILSAMGNSAMMQSYASYFQFDIWEEMLQGSDGALVSDLITDEQYDLLYGSWPQAFDEIVLIVNENNEISDLTLYALGLKTSDQMIKDMEASSGGELVDSTAQRWSYDDIVKCTFKLILPDDMYEKAQDGSYIDLSATQTGLDYLYNSAGTEIKIVGVVRPSESAVSSMMSGSIGYTTALTDYIIKKTADCDIVREQLSNPETDVILNLPFKTDDKKELTADEIKDAVDKYFSSADASKRAEAYIALMSIPSDDYVNKMVQNTLQNMTRDTIIAQIVAEYEKQGSTAGDKVIEYINGLSDAELYSYVEKSVREKIISAYAAQIKAQFASLTVDALSSMYNGMEKTEAQYSYLFETFVPSIYSESTYKDNLKLLGYVDENSPSVINVYASTFAAKDEIVDLISEYNDLAEDNDIIKYTDYVGLIMSSITTIINAISYVLIAFVAISLVVSSIMIGIITYISVLERTKEIGILRAIGASKADISRVFNAETLIIGFTSGALGIGVTLLLTIPINLIIHALTDIQILNATLPPAAAVILVIISMCLTLIAGIFPSRIAAKKDPVVALRTE